MSFFSPAAVRVLHTGNILPQDESPDSLVDHALHTIPAVEQSFGTAASAVTSLHERLADFMHRKLLVLGTPMLTNAVRGGHRALGSCVAIPVDVRRPLADIAPSIEAYYEHNMGSGFDLDPADEPAALVLTLNEHAARLTQQRSYDRYIGNMANITIDHPRVREFVRLKAERGGLCHFNLSINVTDQFMTMLMAGADFRLRDGTVLSATALWDEIVNAAWECGDPGLLFLERFNAENPTPAVGRYVTTAPCAEVALAPGESCVFGYVNVAGFAHPDGSCRIDRRLLQSVVALLTRALDDALELSLSRYPAHASRAIMGAKRKIGIGICGYADLLVRLDIPYGSATAISLLEDLLVSISFQSKLTSVELGRQRGSFLGIGESCYVTFPDFLSRKYGRIVGSVSLPEWQSLERHIRATGHLRNASTTALPPAGRSSRLVDASTSLEPWFSLLDPDGRLKAELVSCLRRHCRSGEAVIDLYPIILREQTCQLAEQIPGVVREVAKRAVEIAPLAQVRVVAAATRCVDEAASKTINLPAATGPEVVSDVFLVAWQGGLKAISVYRDGTVRGQPEQLAGASHAPDAGGREEGQAEVPAMVARIGADASSREL